MGEGILDDEASAEGIGVERVVDEIEGEREAVDLELEIDADRRVWNEGGIAEATSGSFS
jgi:hypothetical protein